MKCAVCIKQVPSTNKVRLDPETNTMIRDGKQSVVNPFDFYALEEAVRVKERTNGSVTVISMGIPTTERLLRDTLSRGADRAALLCDRAFAGSDTLATSYTLSLAIKHLGGFDLIFCGKMAVDGDTAQVGPELAEMLGMAHVTEVAELIELSDGYVKVKKSAEHGWEILKVKLPALLCVLKDINLPRMSSVAGIKYSLSAPLETLDAKLLNADVKRTGLSGSPTQVVRAFPPQRQGESVKIAGSPVEQANAIKEIICGTDKVGEVN